MAHEKITIPIEVDMEDLDRLSLIFALTIEAEAIRTHVLGMQSRNQFNPEKGYYDDEHFKDAAYELHLIADKLSKLGL